MPEYSITIPLWGIVTGVTSIIVIGVQIGSFTKKFVTQDELKEVEQKISKLEKKQDDSIRRLHSRFDDVFSMLQKVSEDVAFFRGTHSEK
jgi:uncharacterized membrane-anchored protein YhcB (DUF1043 family)